jgi:GrpB-like predicted nucleotidyltransferase (UPF0157 family)
VVRGELLATLVGRATRVERVGSTAVPGLLAKPILDFVVGVDAGNGALTVKPLLESAGWEYRGDAGNDGGLVFVLATRPLHRVAHAHVVEYCGAQWRSYLMLRDRLRADPRARESYGAAKLDLCALFPTDRHAYTNGKTAVIRALLDDSVASGATVSE